MNTSRHNDCMDGIAIISMVGRFPGSKSVEAFWQNLVDGKELISFLTDEELKAAGIAHGLISNPNYIKAQGVLEDTGTFDARFFDINPREAEVLDPQHRVFLECAWEALEKAGYDSESYQGSIGVFASASMNSYVFNIFLNPDVLHTSSIRQITLGNDKDGLPLRVSYKLNLKGPSLAIQTSCSSSLVAVHLACQSLLNYECDMALAGGATIGVPHPSGYIYTPGGLLSPDGHCRAFDSEAHGMVGGNGVGIVVLKRLTNAISDGDQIYAVIKGSAINNDGNTKAGYTAPSIDGQAEVITMAQSVAGVDPEDISYIEAHGTGTELGDPIEVAALTQAFRARTDSKGFCGIGSVKTNIGHLDATAGIAGLIKTALALHHKALPPTLHYKTPNPKIDIENSPFYVVDKLTEWKADSTPRLAGVSSFGIGGTNAHVVLQESPVIGDSGESKKKQLILLSAKSQTALDKATRNLVEHLRQNEDLNLADVAYTLQSGRRRFSHRRMVVSSTLEESVVALENHDPKRVLSDYQEATDRPVVFMFPGQGSQYVNMGLELYQQEPVFREQVDLCSQLLKSHLGFDLREILYPSDEYIEEARLKLDQTFITQPALFVIEYALAKLWMQWGIKPQAMIGHSIGEYVAACLAEVISLQEALELVTARGKLIQELPVGAMLSVSRPYEDVQPLLSSGLSLAASNGPSHCTISGPADAITALEVQLAEQGIEGRRLRTSHAFHSSMMDQIKAVY